MGRGRRRLAWLMCALVGAGLIAGCGAGASSEDVTAAEIRLEPAGVPGSAPFTRSVAVEEGSLAAPPDDGSGVVLDGDAPRRYAATRGRPACDREALVAALEAGSERAATWARAEGIERDDLDAFVATLTPLLLRNDIRVTNHDYANGHAVARQAVLQAGTAVLVDPNGVPRVRCSCGNPLADPVGVTLRYERDRWRGFDPAAVRTVTRSHNPLREFLLTDIGSGETVLRPVGTAGSFDTEPDSRGG